MANARLAKEMHRNAEAGAKLTAANARFALNLFKAEAAAASSKEADDRNVFVSPLTVSAALAIIYLGAKESTSSQMKSALCFDGVEADQLHPTFAEILNALKRSGDGAYTLQMVNRLYAEKTQKFVADFSQQMKKYYSTGSPAAINFKGRSDAAEAAAKEINLWMAKQTHAKITDIVSASDIDDHTRLILISAAHLRGSWSNQFKRRLTKPADFSISETETVTVQMMYVAEAEARYGESANLNCHVIELPYRKNALSMFVILPDTNVTSLAEVEAKLTADHLVDIEDAMQKCEVNVYLPRFRLDKRSNLTNTLSGMGMQDLVTEGAADLSGLDCGSSKLFLSGFFHGARIEVNEEEEGGGRGRAGERSFASVEAAAGARSTHPETFECVTRVETFRADHPFIFFVRDNATKSILFVGKLVRPTNWEIDPRTVKKSRRPVISCLRPRTVTIEDDVADYAES